MRTPPVRVIKESYKGFSIGQTIIFKVDTECQYYDYPMGKNMNIAKAGSIGVIRSISPKVRINMPDTGEYFFNVIQDGICYSVNNYHNIKKARSNK